jgi:ubiquinone/menaquinone biosynthesis C-methylase UbiE
MPTSQSQPLAADIKLVKSHFSANAGEYEKMTGGATRRIIDSFSQYLPPMSSTSSYLDNAAGPGVVTRFIIDLAKETGVDPPPRVVAADFAPGMVELAQKNKEAEGWDTVETMVLDAQNLKGLKDDEFDATVMNFALFALPDTNKGASEMLRVIKPGGVAIVTTWKRSRAVEIMEEALQIIRPGSQQKIFPLDPAWKTKEKLQEVMVASGFPADKMHIFESTTIWGNGDADALVEALSGPFWKGIMADWSNEEKGNWRGSLLKVLTDKEKVTGSIDMTAWVCVAKK